MNTLWKWCAPRMTRTLTAGLIGLALLASALPADAQKDKKKKKDAPASTDSTPIVPMGDQQQIDYLISEMLGAWQLGDIEKLHKNYADDVSVVSGVWTPPIFGWQSYLAAYQAQRERTRQVRLERSNTYVKVSGNFAWACYQWDFVGAVDGLPAHVIGQTTLILEKRNNRWMIVHNHTSVVQGSPDSTGPAPPAGTQPTRPQEGAKPAN